MATADPQALLKRLLQEPTETTWLEFKQNNSDPELIGRTLSACANAAMLLERDRAFIVWGIENKTKKKLGTTVRLTEIKKGNENLENWLAHVIDPRLMMELLDFEEDGKLFSILSFEPTYTRPVKFLGTEYIRIGENVRPLKEHDEHERSLWIATSRRKFESGVALPHQSVTDVLAKLHTATYYERSRQTPPTTPQEVLRKFVALGALREDMEGGYDITNLGAILFANDLTQFPSIAGKSVRVIKYAGVDKRKSEDEIEGRRGYAVGFPGMLKYISERLPKEERYERGVRQVVSKYSATAVREIIANALIHQDFTISGVGPVVEIYQDRIEVTNPGNSLVELYRIIDERRSRNEKLAQAMREIGLCEERGGGIDKAILEIEEMFLPAPTFLPSVNSMRVILPGPRKFNQLSKSDKMWSCYCHCVVRWIRQDFMSNTTLRERFSLADEEYQMASDVIANSKKAKLIKPADPAQGNKYAKYIPYWA
jgi:ATP-dependent DNA helicase RecG